MGQTTPTEVPPFNPFIHPSMHLCSAVLSLLCAGSCVVGAAAVGAWGQGDRPDPQGQQPTPPRLPGGLPISIYLICLTMGLLVNRCIYLPIYQFSGQSVHLSISSEVPCCSSVCTVYVCVQGGHDDVARLLLQHGASLSDENRDGGTPLHAAAWKVGPKPHTTREGRGRGHCLGGKPRTAREGGEILWVDNSCVLV